MFITNRFGSGELYSMEEMLEAESVSGRPIAYCTSTACLSVTTDIQSWVSNPENKSKIIFTPNNLEGNNGIIIVLGCQVTDLAILNDIRTVEKLHAKNPSAKVYMGGCLAYRFDIELPSYVRRLAASRSINTPLDGRRIAHLHWEKPFWVSDTDWKEHTEEFDDGRIFRDMYPLKIGAGCHGSCRYCTIRDTRGEGYELDPYLQVKEFINAENIVLVSDSPGINQVIDWCHLAIRYDKSISIRNIEPETLTYCMKALEDVAKRGLLKILHCPIQSNNPELLQYMGRRVEPTLTAIEFMQNLRKHGVKVATNIIIDYTVEIAENGETKAKFFHNLDEDWMNKHFDYWSWNPYFDGKWDRKNAEARFERYMPRDKDS